MLAALPVELSLTTNGATLESLADDAGRGGPAPREHLARLAAPRALRRADPPRRAGQRPRRDRRRACGPGLGPVKVNVVVLRGINDDELVDLARYGRERGVHLRFIEFMPLDASGGWLRDQVVSQAEIVDTISAVFPLGARRPGTRERAGRPLPLPGRRRRDRGHPERHRALLRLLRPAPSHRRRPAAQLPVQPGRPRPARPAPPGRVRTTTCPRPSRPAWPPRPRATPSTRCTSCAPSDP